jgi:hypothetical protein
MPFRTDGDLLARLRSPRLFPHEWIVLVYIGAALWILEHMPVTYPRTALFIAYANPIFGITSIAFLLALMRRKRGTLGVPFAGEALAILRIVVPLMLAWATHFLLKSFIFVINPRTWDRELAVLDQQLHLGFSPSTFFTTLIQAPALLIFIDAVYSGIYFLIVIGYAAAFVGLLPIRRKLAFGVSFILLWVVGSSLYVAFPSWGPVYVFSDEFIGTLRYMPLTVAVQKALFEEISSLVRNPEALRYVRFGSVAAFPSLHVGVVTLYTLTSRFVSRRWFAANCGLLGVMIVGSVVTGYHYLLDGWAGMLLAFLLWLAATRYFVGRDPEDALREPGDDSLGGRE